MLASFTARVISPPPNYQPLVCFSCLLSQHIPSCPPYLETIKAKMNRAGYVVRI
jgi:hypothetical protein